MKDLMLDLETLGTAADSVILSVGAVKFELESDKMDPKGFYGSISVESNLDAGRRISEDTLLWWLKQPTAAQHVFFEDKLSLEQVLCDLADWLVDDRWQVWAKGPAFDVAMLEHAYKSFGMSTPWQFWNVRCVRTYEGLPGAKGVKSEVPMQGTAHNALSDAVHQAQIVQRVHRKLFSPAKVA